MLYKKIHRQYLRQFRKGRMFRGKYRGDVFESGVYKITSRPYIDSGEIWIDCGTSSVGLIDLSLSNVQFRDGEVIWLD